ncbi:cysteine hydrolase family protein [Cellulomonas soli]|uniref:cysteine hydrolase family protein n=1 Tax=Cellulomonas soli TaxID=931535 RepID=UPI003F868647
MSAPDAGLGTAPVVPEPSPVSLRTVLAVIDMQNVFGDPASPWCAPRFDEVVEPVHRLAQAFADRAVFTRFISPATPIGAWRAYYEDWPFALQPPAAPLWDVVPALAADAAAVVGTDGDGGTLDAPTFSKWGPELARLVGPAGRLVLAGVSTDCCVLSTALAAADAGVEVVVVADACTGIDDESHTKALDVMRLYAPLVTVATVVDVLTLAQSEREAQAAREAQVARAAASAPATDGHGDHHGR